MTSTLSRPWTISLWVARVLVAIPFFIAAWLEGMSSPETLAEMELVWIPGAPLWLVRGGGRRSRGWPRSA